MAKKISLKKDAESVLKAYDAMKSYGIQEDLLQSLIKNYPDHSNTDAVEVKVKLLNLFYSTGIKATNAMTENILSINDIDKRLAKGDISLVEEIATLKLKKAPDITILLQRSIAPIISLNFILFTTALSQTL